MFSSGDPREAKRLCAFRSERRGWLGKKTPKKKHFKPVDTKTAGKNTIFMIIWPFIEGCEGFSLTFIPCRAEYLTQMPSDKHQPAQRCSGGSAECRRSTARRERGSTSHQFREAVSTAIMERRFLRVFFPSHGSTTKKIHRNERLLFFLSNRGVKGERFVLACKRAAVSSQLGPRRSEQSGTALTLLCLKRQSCCYKLNLGDLEKDVNREKYLEKKIE